MNFASVRSELSLKRTDVKHLLPLVTLGLRWRNASRPTIRASRKIRMNPPRSRAHACSTRYDFSVLARQHHTDPQAAMGQMTYSPEKCEYTGVLYYCNGEHALPNASAGMISSGTTTDTRLMRGICLQGFHYERGGCQKD